MGVGGCGEGSTKLKQEAVDLEYRKPRGPTRSPSSGCLPGRYSNSKVYRS